MNVISPIAAGRLARRRPLRLDPGGAIAIKRNVQEFSVEADADRFAAAFRQVLEAPDAIFGLLRVKRLAAHAGRPFRVGERFQAGFALGAVAGRWSWTPRWLRRAADSRVARAVEDLALSDYAELTELSPLRVAYRYLEGSPIAGHSLFEVLPDGPAACRFVATFTFQEVAGWAVELMHRFAAAQHDAVTAEQVRRAAARLGIPC